MPEHELEDWRYDSALSLAGDTSDGVGEFRIGQEEIIGAIGMPQRRIDHPWLDQIETFKQCFDFDTGTMSQRTLERCIEPLRTLRDLKRNPIQRAVAQCKLAVRRHSLAQTIQDGAHLCFIRKEVKHRPTDQPERL